MKYIYRSWRLAAGSAELTVIFGLEEQKIVAAFHREKNWKAA
jgi:hypothetical protein